MCSSLSFEYIHTFVSGPVCAFTHMHMYLEARGHWVSSLSLTMSSLGGLFDQWVWRTHLPLPPQCQDYRCTLPQVTFVCGLGVSDLDLPSCKISMLLTKTSPHSFLFCSHDLLGMCELVCLLSLRFSKSVFNAFALFFTSRQPTSKFESLHILSVFDAVILWNFSPSNYQIFYRSLKLNFFDY